MDSNPRILIWNISDEDEYALTKIFSESGAPEPKAVMPDQGQLIVHELLFDDKHGEVLDNSERLVLFFNVQGDVIEQVMAAVRQSDVERPIYAVVTEQNINWRFNDLLDELVRERESFANRQA